MQAFVRASSFVALIATIAAAAPILSAVEDDLSLDARLAALDKKASSALEVLNDKGKKLSRTHKDPHEETTVASLVAGRVGALTTHRKLRMTKPDATMLADLLFAPSTMRYFEWGSGGSTELVAWRANAVGGIFKAHAVDSSQDWLDSLRADSPAIRAAEASGAVTLHAVDVGQTVAWGVPANWTQRPLSTRHKQGSAYVDVIDEAAESAGGLFDLVLVDGRFRVACALKALQHLAPTSTLLIHDFYYEKRQKVYGQVLDWYDEVVPEIEGVARKPQADVLAVLRPKVSALRAARSWAPEYIKALRADELMEA